METSIPTLHFQVSKSSKSKIPGRVNGLILQNQKVNCTSRLNQANVVFPCWCWRKKHRFLPSFSKALGSTTQPWYGNSTTKQLPLEHHVKHNWRYRWTSYFIGIRLYINIYISQHNWVGIHSLYTLNLFFLSLIRWIHTFDGWNTSWARSFNPIIYVGTGSIHPRFLCQIGGRLFFFAERSTQEVT